MASRATRLLSSVQRGGVGDSAPFARIGQLIKYVVFFAPNVTLILLCSVPTRITAPFPLHYRLDHLSICMCIGSSVLSCSLLGNHFMSHHRRFQWILSVRSLTEHRIALVWCLFLAPVWNLIPPGRSLVVHICASSPSFTNKIVCLTSVVCFS